MLALVTLLQAVTLGAQAAPSLPPRRLADLIGADCDAKCARDDDQRRYRLDADVATGDDAKDRALQGVWRPCETTGAPVCPGKGSITLRASLDSD